MFHVENHFSVEIVLRIANCSMWNTPKLLAKERGELIPRETRPYDPTQAGDSRMFHVEQALPRLGVNLKCQIQFAAHLCEPYKSLPRWRLSGKRSWRKSMDAMFHVERSADNLRELSAIENV